MATTSIAKTATEIGSARYNRTLPDSASCFSMFKVYSGSCLLTLWCILHLNSPGGALSVSGAVPCYFFWSRRIATGRVLRSFKVFLLNCRPFVELGGILNDECFVLTCRISLYSRLRRDVDVFLRASKMAIRKCRIEQACRKQVCTR